MKPLLFLFGIFLFSGCVGNNHNTKNDSLTAATADTNVKNIPHYADSLQNKVIGDINFGITSKDFETLSNAFVKSRQVKRGYKIGNFVFIIMSPDYFKNRLYQVTLENPFVHNDDELTNGVQGALDVIKAKYGSPDTSNAIGTILEGYQRDLYVWHIGRKQIKIIASRPYNEYSIDVVFTDTKIASQIHETDRLHRDSTTASDKTAL